VHLARSAGYTHARVFTRRQHAAVKL